MSKKLIMSCMAAAAFAAFVLPATASALNTPTLTDAGGHVAVGSKIWGTNVGDTIFYDTKTETKQVTCTTADFTGEVTKNSENTVEGKITLATFAGTGAVHPDNNHKECANIFGAGAAITVTRMPLIVKSTQAMADDEVQISGTGGNIRFDIIDTTVGTCEYEATNAAIIAHYTTGTSASEDATVTTTDTEKGSGAKKIAGGFFCPTSGVLKMTFTLETDTGNSTADPIWIS